MRRKPEGESAVMVCARSAPCRSFLPLVGRAREGGKPQHYPSPLSPTRGGEHNVACLSTRASTNAHHHFTASPSRNLKR